MSTPLVLALAKQRLCAVVNFYLERFPQLFPAAYLPRGSADGQKTDIRFCNVLSVEERRAARPQAGEVVAWYGGRAERLRMPGGWGGRQRPGPERRLPQAPGG